MHDVTHRLLLGFGKHPVLNLSLCFRYDLIAHFTCTFCFTNERIYLLLFECCISDQLNPKYSAIQWAKEATRNQSYLLTSNGPFCCQATYLRTLMPQATGNWPDWKGWRFARSTIMTCNFWSPFPKDHGRSAIFAPADCDEDSSWVDILSIASPFIFYCNLLFVKAFMPSYA